MQRAWKMKGAKRMLTMAACHVLLLTGPVLSKCCYTISSQVLSSATFAVSLSVSSQTAFDSPGMVYKASIKFPSSYLITSMPVGCSYLSSASVNCQSSGQSRLQVSFSNITAVPDGTAMNNIVDSHPLRRTNFGGANMAVVEAAVVLAGPPNADSVVVNGESCVVNTACPTLSHNSGFPPTSTIRGQTQPTSATSSSPSPPLSPSSSSSNKGLIIGVSCAAAMMILLVGWVVLRRARVRSSSRGAGEDRKGSQYSLNRANDSTTTTHAAAMEHGNMGPDSYTLYPEKMPGLDRSLRDLHEPAMFHPTVSAEVIVPRVLERLRSFDAGAKTEYVAPEEEATAEETELTQRPSNKTSRSTASGKMRAQPPETSIVEIPPPALFDEGLNLDEYFRTASDGSEATTREDASRSAPYHSDNQQEQQQHQYPLLRKSKSSRFPRVPKTGSGSGSGSSSSALKSAPVAGQQATLHRAASAGTIRSTVRGNYQMDNIIDPYRQQPPLQQDHQGYLGLRSEPISLSGWTPQLPPAVPTRSLVRHEKAELEAHRDNAGQQAVRTEDKVGSHGLYGYL